MSNALKNAVESSTSTLSGLVDEARARLEELPPLANARRKRARKRTSMIGLLVLAVAAMIMAKQARQPAVRTIDQEQ